MFGEDCVNLKDRNVSVTVDGVTVSIDTQTRVSSASCFHTLNYDLLMLARDEEVQLKGVLAEILA